MQAARMTSRRPALALWWGSPKAAQRQRRSSSAEQTQPQARVFRPSIRSTSHRATFRDGHAPLVLQRLDEQARAGQPFSCFVNAAYLGPRLTRETYIVLSRPALHLQSLYQVHRNSACSSNQITYINASQPDRQYTTRCHLTHSWMPLGTSRTQST